VWPIVPGLLMIGFGAVLQGALFGAPFDRPIWLGWYWPVCLVATGLWLMFRDRIPVSARAPVAVVGATVFIVIGLLVAAAGVASVVGPYARTGNPMLWPGFQPPMLLGGPPLQDTVTLSAPVGSTTSVRLVNTRGSAVMRTSGSSEVHVLATRHYWIADRIPDVRFVTSGGVLAIETTNLDVAGRMGSGAYVDYVVDVPASFGADVRSASGSIEVGGLEGATTIQAASGSVRLTDVAGAVRVSTASGDIRGSGLARMAEARTSSGSIDLGGDFTDAAQIWTASGQVTLRLSRLVGAHVDATSTSGDISVIGLDLIDARRSTHALSGDVGTASHTVSVHTSSGDIRLIRDS
jgi:hypothetical protein